MVRNRKGIYVSNLIIEDHNIPPAAKLVYIVFYKNMDTESKTCTISYTDLMEIAALSRNTLVNAINILCRNRYVYKHKKCTNSPLTNEYYIFDEPYDDTFNPPKEEVIERKRKVLKRQPGYVYFVKADNGLIKIGKTKDLKSRWNHFTTKLPYELELLHSIKTDDCNELELYFHKKFSSKRQRGEWFQLNDSDIKEIENSNVLN